VPPEMTTGRVVVVVVVGGGLVDVVVGAEVGGVVACVELPPKVGSEFGAGGVGVDVLGTVVEVEDVDVDGAVGIDVAGDSGGVVTLVLAGEPAPGCSLATTMPISAVAPVAASTAERVRRRKRRLTRSRDCGVLGGFRCFMVDAGPFSFALAGALTQSRFSAELDSCSSARESASDQSGHHLWRRCRGPGFE
jgi:hypothetical protein